MSKKMAAAGLAAGLVAGTGAGFLLSITGSAGATGLTTAAITAVDDTTDDTTDATTNATTDDSDRAAEHSARLTEVLQPLVDDGTLTQAQLDAVIAALGDAGPMGGGHGGPGGGRGEHLDVVATTLGLTEAEVREAISNGQTLAQLAEANGSTGQALIDVLVAEVKAHLDEEVAAGDHTQEEADAKLADATTRITEFVNNTDTAGPMGGPGEPGGRGGPRGHHGADHDADADDSTDDSTTETVTVETVTADTSTAATTG